jgi:hypothetical protein
MRKRARTVLCGGRSAMVVPTASADYYRNSTTQTILRRRSHKMHLSADGVAALEWLANAFAFRKTSRLIDQDGKLSHGE